MIRRPSHRSTSHRSNRRAGFSLIEVLVVIVIITVLATVVAVNLLGAPDDAKRAATLTNITNVKTALEKYNLDNGFYPSQAQGLQALVVRATSAPAPKKWPQDGYLDKLPLDGWGAPLAYLVPGRDGRRFEVFSLGKDGQVGGEEANADISSADP